MVYRAGESPSASVVYRILGVNGGIMAGIPIGALKVDTFFSEPVFIDQRYILLVPETPVTQALINHLTEWEIREVFSEGVAKEATTGEDGFGTEEVDDVVAAHSAGDRENVEKVSVYFEQFLKYVESVYTKYVTKNEINLKELSDRVKVLCDSIGENRKYILRVIGKVIPSSNYLVNHSARSTVIAIVLGSQLKVPPHRLIELGVASILHEIGMVRLPPQLYMADRALNPQERKAITTHPILGYNILKEKQFPLAVSLTALEHHERMNGTGYPRALSGDKVSLYARIVAVACSYDAATGARPYRAAKESYLGMMDILRNEGKQYDPAVIHALVYAFSVYPIGSYVLLTNGKKAQVVDVNADNPRYPIVLVLGTRTPDGKEVTVQTSETGLRILRPIGAKEAEEADKDPSS